eukprot:s965_g7.t1
MALKTDGRGNGCESCLGRAWLGGACGDVCGRKGLRGTADTFAGGQTAGLTPLKTNGRGNGCEGGKLEAWRRGKLLKDRDRQCEGHGCDRAGSTPPVVPGAAPALAKAGVGPEVPSSCPGSRPCSAPKDVRRSLSPWRRSLGVNSLAVRPASCASRRSAWTTDGRRTDRRMPKLTRKQRARGAKEKLDQLCAPALRTLRLNLLNVRAWMQPEQIEKGRPMPSEEDDLCHEDMATPDQFLSPQDLFCRQISAPKLVTPEEPPGLLEPAAPDSPTLTMPRVRLDMEAVDRQARAKFRKKSVVGAVYGLDFRLV